jgi:hypothetical protein
MTSLSALTSADVLTYETTTCPGRSSINRRKSSGGQLSASEHPASKSGNTTIFSEFKTLAVSAIKWTPQKTITSASVPCACLANPRESPTKSARSWISGSW